MVSIKYNKAQKETLDESKKQKRAYMRHDHIKTGGVLPIFIGIATAIGALGGGGATIANAVISAKQKNAEKKKKQRQC